MRSSDGDSLIAMAWQVKSLSRRTGKLAAGSSNFLTLRLGKRERVSPISVLETVTGCDASTAITRTSSGREGAQIHSYAASQTARRESSGKRSRKKQSRTRNG